MKSLIGKIAVLTGAASGFGLELARLCAGQGMKIVMADVQQDALDRAAAEVAALGQPNGAEVLAYRLDVSKADQVEALGAATLARFGAPHLVFNNAGVGAGGLIWEHTLADWEWVIGVNLMGVAHGVRVFTPMMLAAAKADPDWEGHIVNTASMAGLTAAGLLTSYVMSKHAIVGLSLALRTEAAAHGVGVLVVCPAAVETPMLDADGVGGFTGRTYYLSGQGIRTPYPADRLASDTLRAIGRNQPLLVVPAQARMAWRFSRISPGLMQTMATRFVAGQRERQGL